VWSTDQPRIDKRKVHSIAQSFSFFSLASCGLDYFLADFWAIFDIGEEANRGLEAELRVIVDFHQPVPALVIG